MEIQMAIGSDVAMCLDSMPLIEKSKKEIEDAVIKTTMWALRCKVHHKKIWSKHKKRQLLFGITQGGIHADLRERSCKELAELDMDGYSCGGLALGEPKEKMLEMLEIHKSIIPKEKPCYLMGLGSPVELVEAIELGADIFDSRFPTQNARRGTIFTDNGKLRILRLENKFDERPLDKKCTCFVCKNYSRAYIHYQLKMKESVGYRLASFHNLFYLQQLMRECQKAIKEKRLKKFLNLIRKKYDEN